MKHQAPDDSDAHESLNITSLVWETEAERTDSRNTWQNERNVVAEALTEALWTHLSQGASTGEAALEGPVRRSGFGWIVMALTGWEGV